MLSLCDLFSLFHYTAICFQLYVIIVLLGNAGRHPPCKSFIPSLSDSLNQFTWLSITCFLYFLIQILGQCLVSGSQDFLSALIVYPINFIFSLSDIKYYRAKHINHCSLLSLSNKTKPATLVSIALALSAIILVQVTRSVI